MQKDLRDTKNSAIHQRDVTDGENLLKGQFILTNPTAEPLEAASVGELLMHARELAGLSAEDVATRLRMGLKQVKALECADYNALPSGTFLRGFVRNYAKAVGVDTALALTTLERTHSNALALAASPVVTPATVTIMKTMQTSRETLATPKVRAAIVIGVVLLLAAAVWYWWENVRPYMADGGRAKIAASAESATAQSGTLALSNSTGALNTDANALLPPAEAAGSQAEAGTNQTPVTQPNVTAIVPATAPAVNAIPSVTIPPINTPSATITATEPVPPILNTQSALISAAASAQANLGGGAARLGFTFSGQSWVEVTDKSGATILSRKFNAGDSEEITGRGPFTIVVGNATVTRMAYNGREFDLTPHRRANGTVARVNLK